MFGLAFPGLQVLPGVWGRAICKNILFKSNSALPLVLSASWKQQLTGNLRDEGQTEIQVLATNWNVKH